MQKKFVLLSAFSLLAFFSFAQPAADTVSMNLHEAEAMFVKNNLRLLVQQYSIDSTAANIITAKLYDNPQFSYDNGFYQPVTHKLFDLSNNNWEMAAQVSQLLKTAGKRNKAIQLAQSQVKISQYQFFDLLRTLRYTLRVDFYNIYFLQQSAAVYTKEIESLQKTTAAIGGQVTKGNIAKKEFVRIQSQLYSLQQELATLQNTIEDAESEFKLLVRAKATAYVIPVMDPLDDQQTIAATKPYQSLLDSAQQNRYDLKIAKTMLDINQQNLKLQKAMSVPDITVNLSYDKQGSFVNNYNSIGFSVPLPLFNRNQGNIKQAKVMIESGKAQLTAQQDQVESDVANAYAEAVRSEKLLNSFDPAFHAGFEYLIGEVFKNYEKRNLTLLEFIDFYDAYKLNILQLNNLRYNRMSALEKINFSTGTPLFNN